MLAAYPTNLPILFLSVIILWRLIRNIQDRTYCRKTKPLTVNPDFLLWSRILLIIRSDCNNSSPSLCRCYLYWDVFPWHLAPFSLQDGLRTGAEEKVTGCPVWWGRQMANQWNAVLGQKFLHFQGRWAWHIAEVQKIHEAGQQTAPPGHSRKVLWTAWYKFWSSGRNTWSFTLKKVISIGKIFDQICFTFFGQGDEGIFQSCLLLTQCCFSKCLV